MHLLHKILGGKANSVLFVFKFYGPVDLMGSKLRAVSLPNHTFTGQA